MTALQSKINLLKARILQIQTSSLFETELKEKLIAPLQLELEEKEALNKNECFIKITKTLDQLLKN